MTGARKHAPECRASIKKPASTKTPSNKFKKIQPKLTTVPAISMTKTSILSITSVESNKSNAPHLADVLEAYRKIVSLQFVGVT